MTSNAPIDPDVASQAYQQGAEAYIASFRNPLIELKNPFDPEVEPEQYDAWDSGLMDAMRGREAR
jgi:hypothetical protein